MDLELKKYEGQILDLTSDIAFKRVFSDEHFKYYLSYLISFCTKIDINEVYKKIKHQNPFLTSKNLDSKTGEADILVSIKDMLIDIKMNRELSEQLFKKNKEYVSMLDSIHTKKSKRGKIRNKYIVQINISPKRRIPGTEVLLYEIVQMDRNLKVEDVYNNHIIYDINLEYLREELYNKGKLTKEEKGLLMFIETKKEKITKIFKGDERMEETIDDLDAAKFLEADKAFYESYDHEAFEKLVHEEAMEEELAEAREKATEEGIKEGIRQKQIEIAKAMIEENYTVEQISKITKISIDDIEEIKKS